MIEECPRCGYGPIDTCPSSRRKKCPACFVPFVLTREERRRRPTLLDDHPRLFPEDVEAAATA